MSESWFWSWATKGGLWHYLVWIAGSVLPPTDTEHVPNNMIHLRLVSICKKDKNVRTIIRKNHHSLIGKAACARPRRPVLILPF